VESLSTNWNRQQMRREPAIFLTTWDMGSPRLENLIDHWTETPIMNGFVVRNSQDRATAAIADG
jgi:hypothetical protein